VRIVDLVPVEAQCGINRSSASVCGRIHHPVTEPRDVIVEDIDIRVTVTVVVKDAPAAVSDYIIANGDVRPGHGIRMLLVSAYPCRRVVQYLDVGIQHVQVLYSTVGAA